MSNLGEGWRQLGEHHKAIECFNQALGIDQRVYGDAPHPYVAIHLNNLGLAWHCLGEYHKAIECFTQALGIDQKVYGDMPRTVACLRNNVGQAWLGLEEHHKAIECFTQALVIAQSEVPPVSWTPEHLCSRSPPWPESTHLTRRSSGVR